MAEIFGYKYKLKMESFLRLPFRGLIKVSKLKEIKEILKAVPCSKLNWIILKYLAVGSKTDWLFTNELKMQNGLCWSKRWGIGLNLLKKFTFPSSENRLTLFYSCRPNLSVSLSESSGRKLRTNKTKFFHKEETISNFSNTNS